jgi:pyruvate decarboxylase
VTFTVGSYLARRLQQIGLKHHFAVAGDFNLVLLDQLLTVKELEQVYCCNELNCCYSAEGYARACGAAAAVVTFSVGGLSAINSTAADLSPFMQSTLLLPAVVVRQALRAGGGFARLPPV